MASSVSMSPVRRFQYSEDNFEYTRSSLGQSSPVTIRPQGRYGSRSVERSLQHYQYGFGNPLKSLSPLAIRLAQENDEEVDGNAKPDLEEMEASLVARHSGQATVMAIAAKRSAKAPPARTPSADLKEFQISKNRKPSSENRRIVSVDPLLFPRHEVYTWLETYTRRKIFIGWAYSIEWRVTIDCDAVSGSTQ